MQRDTLNPTDDMGALDNPTLEGSLVYRKSGLGAAQLATDHGKALSPRERQVLILVNGQRTIDELCDLLGAETVQRLIPDLEARGFAKLVDPEVPAEWAVTQLRLPAADSRPLRGARDLREPRYPLAWIGLLVVLAGLGTGWAFQRFRAQIDSRSQFDSAQTQSIEANAAPASTVPIDGKPQQHRAPTAVTPVTHRPAGVPLEAAAVSPERVVRRGTPRAGETIAAVTPPDSPATAEAADTRPHAEAANPPPPGVAVNAPRAAPDPSNSARTADAPRALVEPAASAKAGDASRSPAEPSTLEPATPAKAADSPSSAPKTEVAMQVPAAQAAGDAVKLHPLRHDPPQVPPKVVLSGIVEGHVRAHLWITSEGKVDQVDIIEASPPRVLDDEVRRVLSLWTYEPPGRASEDIVELTLKP